MTPQVCCIGTTDPWNAAGLGLDLRAFADLGLRALSVVVAVSAQDAGGVSALHAIPDDVVRAQLAALRSAQIVAYRIGALAAPGTVDVLAEQLRGAGVPVVYDPVFAPSGGGRFADDRLVERIARRLLPVVTLVTPNLGEAEKLARIPVDGIAEMHAAGRALVALGAGAALVKGGHLQTSATDVLVAQSEHEFSGTRIDATLRGTGCLLADAIVAALVNGRSLVDAVEDARAFVRAKLANARELGVMRVAY